MPKLEKGGHAPLNVTQESRHRIYVGLGWDPNARISIMQEARALVGGKKAHHDLDLSCYIYDEKQNFIESVAVDTEKAADKTGFVFHSGDNEAGFGEGDDEQISAELKNLPDHIHHLVFKASIKSGHVFGEVEVPEIHLSDGYSNHSFLRAALDQDDGKDKSVYLFAHIYRAGDGWALHNIDAFFDTKTTDIWERFIKDYLTGE